MRTTSPFVVAVLVLLAVCVPPSASARPMTHASVRPALKRTQVPEGTFRVGVADYTLGDHAFTFPGLYRNDDAGASSGLAPIELTGRVYYPVTRTRRPRPMVVMLHGSWETCADRRAALLQDQALALENAWDTAHPGDKGHPGPPEPDQAALDKLIGASAARLNRWPCASGTPSLSSYTGFDYLGRALASHGVIAVSISANGINAVGLGDIAVEARAALINKHLAMWATLDRTGRGPLAGRFTRPRSSVKVHPRFRRTIDLGRVGTLGHSRGGKAVFWQAADAHSTSVPRGVHIRAMVSLAPEGAAEVEPGSAQVANYRVSRTPFLVWEGTCDFATSHGGDDYLRFNEGPNRSPHYRLLVHGADHNYLNEQWSPSSGQVAANDDVDTPGVPRPVPGRCTDADGSRTELGEFAERRASRTYVTAFFLRELAGEVRWQPVLTGAVRPLRNQVDLDIATTRAG